MTQEELEKRIRSKILEAFALLLEYDPGCTELNMEIKKNSISSYLIKSHNDAYKHDVKPLLLFSMADKKELKFKSVDIDDLLCSEAIMYAYDKAAREIKITALECIGKEETDLHRNQLKLVRLTLDTQREALKQQIKEACR
jgi:hypothetical protein